jgi:4'-phosphopantetheinyl transferase
MAGIRECRKNPCYICSWTKNPSYGTPERGNCKETKKNVWWLSMNPKKDFHRIFHFESAGIRQNNKTEYADNFPVLENDSLHIWSVRYSDLRSDFSFVSEFLSKRERDKSSRFSDPADSRRYVLRHGMMRYILGEYTGSEPELLPLVEDMNGKPGLDPKSEFREFSFSLSHTNQIVSLGVMKNYRIGIDIVKTDPGYPIYEICDYLFTSAEKEFMRGIEPAQRNQMFFRIWALKEAIVKATGEGIRMMHKTDVTPVVGSTGNASLYMLIINGIPQDFFIFPFSPYQEYIGAAAICLDGEK